MDRFLLYCIIVCIIRTYFPLGGAFKLLYMLQNHVIEFIACAQLCISSFTRHSTLIAEVNSCINFNFCKYYHKVILSKIRGILKL